MRTLALVALVAPTLAVAQVQVSGGIRVDLPVVIPQLVVIQPGIQVVPDVDVEVFHVHDAYWTRHEGRWYRAATPRGGWVVVERGVPPGLVRLEPGRYRRFRPDRAQGDWERAKDRREHRRELAKDRREHEREAAKDWREHEREAAKDRREHERELAKDRRERD